MRKKRKKRLPNKGTQILIDTLREIDLEPIQGILDALDELNNIICEKNSERIELVKIKIKTFLELMSYVYPRRKAIEILQGSNLIPNDIIVKWADEDESSHATTYITSKTDQ